jgi:hypothetical protein
MRICTAINPGEPGVWPANRPEPQEAASKEQHGTGMNHRLHGDIGWRDRQVFLARQLNRACLNP